MGDDVGHGARFEGGQRLREYGFLGHDLSRGEDVVLVRCIVRVEQKMAQPEMVMMMFP